MRVLVTGAGGLLGSNVIMRAVDIGHDVVGSYHMTDPELPVPRRQLDIRENDAFRTLVDDIEPGVVVNCAAMTDVDECESRPDRADEINGRAPGEMAMICAKRDIMLAHVSTDYVFDGKSESKYKEDTGPNPIQVYGRSKLLGEKLVRKNHPTPLVVRLSFVYGVHRVTGNLQGFPAWVASRLAAKENVPLFVDQRVTPSRAGLSAETILALADTGTDGKYHVASRECVSPYEFGEAICSLVGADDSLLTSSAMEDVSRPASRPTHTCLDVDRVETRLGRPQPELSDDLRAIHNALEPNVTK